MSPFEDPSLFADFLARLRTRERAASNQFVAISEPVILRTIGRRLMRHNLSRQLDPADIAQQVHSRFFAKPSKWIELASMQDLLNLLVTMTNAVIIDEWRKAHAIRRTSGEHTIQYAHLEDIPSPGPLADSHLIEQEQLELIHKLMSEEEWNLAMARVSGFDWQQLARRFGKNAVALRRKFCRLCHRIQRDAEPRHELKGLSPGESTWKAVL